MFSRSPFRRRGTRVFEFESFSLFSDGLRSYSAHGCPTWLESLKQGNVILNIPNRISSVIIWKNKVISRMAFWHIPNCKPYFQFHAFIVRCLHGVTMLCNALKHCSPLVLWRSYNSYRNVGSTYLKLTFSRFALLCKSFESYLECNWNSSEIKHKLCYLIANDI